MGRDKRAEAFSGDISKWDVSRVTNMGAMFYAAHSFNGNISKWKVSNVMEMTSMFTGAKSFNADISKWDVSAVVPPPKHGFYFLADTPAFKHKFCTLPWISFWKKHAKVKSIESRKEVDWMSVCTGVYA